MMQKGEIFNVGDRIELSKLDYKEERSYPSQILDITDEKTFIVSGPIYKNELVLIHKNEKIRLSQIVENKGRYAFDAKVLRREYKNIYKLELQKVSNIKKYQQRKYYRLDISIPVIKEFIINKDKEEVILTESCKTKDISGSGLKLYSNFEHNIGDIIKCKFNIEDYPLDIKGKILRIEEIDTFDFKYSLGINFIELKEDNRDRIIKFIFLNERLLREKGLI